MTTDALKAAYRWHRHQYPSGANRDRPLLAHLALIVARDDVAANKARYPAPLKPYPAVSWQGDDVQSERLGRVENTGHAGLRLVGRVETESYGGSRCWNSSADQSVGGWYADPYSDVFKDGTGLCWGEVYQLPSRNGQAQFVAGYRFGGTDGGPTIDFGTVYTSNDHDSYEGAQGMKAAREAAYAADELARIAAEHKREYQTAWQAGSQWAILGEEIAAERKETLELLAERKAAKARFAAAGIPFDSREWKRSCATLIGAIKTALARIQELRTERADLAAGNHSPLYFYADEKLAAAFNDGAGETVL